MGGAGSVVFVEIFGFNIFLINIAISLEWLVTLSPGTKRSLESYHFLCIIPIPDFVSLFTYLTQDFLNLQSFYSF